MADEQYRWLDRETAERLLSGESLEAVDAAARDQAEQLAKTLGTLAVPHPPAGVELPGEAAALAAFRKAREERAGVGATAARRTGARTEDAGLVRIRGRRGDHALGSGRPRWARRARLGLAAALAVGMVGGVAVAAGTGVLPTPFGGDEPEPAASVSAAPVTPPERPLATPSPDATGKGRTTPESSPSGSPQDGGTGSSRDEASGGTAAKPGATTPGAPSGDEGKGITASCRDVRNGKELTAERKRALENAAGDSSVWAYCAGVLATADGSPAQQDSKGEGEEKAEDESTGDQDGEGDGDSEDGAGDGDRDGDSVSPRRRGAAATSAPPADTSVRPKTLQTAPIYSAL